MRRTDPFKGGGELRESVEFYTVDDEDGTSTTGAPTRKPVLAYTGRANIAPFQGTQSGDANTIVVGEVWATVFIRYHQGRVPVEGMLMRNVKSSEWFEVRGSQNIDYSRRRVELTCRMIRDV